VGLASLGTVAASSEEEHLGTEAVTASGLSDEFLGLGGIKASSEAASVAA